MLLYALAMRREEEERALPPRRTLRTDPAGAPPRPPRGASYFLSGVMGGSMKPKAAADDEQVGLPMESQSYRGAIGAAGGGLHDRRDGAARHPHR